jgi:hypothetical protein
MKNYIKKKLEERNNRIIQAIIKKAENVCPGSIALIGIAGSFHSGDIFEKSDLDLCIVMNDENAKKIESSFIIGDIAFDIYCTAWNRLENMSEYNNPYVTKLLELSIVYYSDKKYKQKYMKLRSKVKNKLKQKFTIKDKDKAEKFVNEAYKEYSNLMLSSKYAECKYATAKLLINIEYAIYMYNKAYVKRGIKRIPEDIVKMKNLPTNFHRLYWNCIKAKKVQEMKKTSTKLMKEVKNFAKQMKDRVTSKKKITKAAIIDTYEEIHSNWKNKMYHAADNNDAYLSLMTAVSCQEFYNEMHEEYHIDKIDLIKNISVDDLTLSAKAFDNAMKKYKKNYDKLNIKVKHYKDLDEFEKEYGKE